MSRYLNKLFLWSLGGLSYILQTMFKNKRHNWDEIALDPRHPDNEVARRFLDLVMSPRYRTLKDPDPKMRDWNVYRAGWGAFAEAQVLGKLQPREAAQHAQCELSQQFCEDLQVELNKTREENDELKRQVAQLKKESLKGTFQCICCKDAFTEEDTLPLTCEFFPTAINISIDDVVVKITVDLPLDNTELKKLEGRENEKPYICKECFSGVAGTAVSRIIERIRNRRHLEMWGRVEGVAPTRGSTALQVPVPAKKTRFPKIKFD